MSLWIKWATQKEMSSHCEQSRLQWPQLNLNNDFTIFNIRVQSNLTAPQANDHIDTVCPAKMSHFRRLRGGFAEFPSSRSHESFLTAWDKSERGKRWVNRWRTRGTVADETIQWNRDDGLINTHRYPSMHQQSSQWSYSWLHVQGHSDPKNLKKRDPMRPKEERREQRRDEMRAI